MSAPQNKPAAIGIIGCGVISRFHARALADYVHGHVVAVADVREEAAQDLATDHGIKTVYTDPAALLADEKVDGVILALPAGLRTALGVAAFEAGKHVLTEKPVAVSAAEVNELLKAQREGEEQFGKPLVGACCSSRYRFTETARKATEFVASGGLGELRQIYCRAVSPAGPPPTSTPPVWRLNRKLNGGGILMNWGSYDLDFLLGILGWELQPQRVLARTWSAPPQLADRAAPGSDAETHFQSTILCENNVSFIYERAEFYPGPASTTWQITGTQGTLQLSMTGTEGDLVVFHDAPHEGGTAPQTIWSGPETFDVHNGPAQDFAEAIVSGHAPRTDFHNSRLIAQICDAIYQSADTGQEAIIE